MNHTKVSDESTLKYSLLDISCDRSDLYLETSSWFVFSLLFTHLEHEKVVCSLHFYKGNR